MDTYGNQAPGDHHGEDRFCPQCGAQMPIGDQFCRSCGEKLTDGPSAKAAKAEKSGHKKVWLPVAVAILLIFAVVVFSQGSGGQSAVVEDVKSVAFGQDAPFETMIERSCDNIQWSQEKLDDNVYQVEVSGTMQAIKYHSELEGTPFYFTLVATYHGDTVYAELRDGSCDGAVSQKAYERLALYYKLQTGEVGYVNGNIAFSDVADQYDDPETYETARAKENTPNSVNDTREKIAWRLFEGSYQSRSEYEQYVIDGYYSLNLVQVSYDQFISEHPEYSTAYYRTNILGLGSENTPAENTDVPDIPQGLGRDWLMENFFPGVSYDALPAIFKQEIDNYAAASDPTDFVDALITDTYVDTFALDLIANEIFSQSFYDLEWSDQCMMILWYCMAYNDGVSFEDFCYSSNDYLGY